MLALVRLRNYLLIFSLLFSLQNAFADNEYITVASTTSTENSGLFDYLLPIFTEKEGIEVRVVAVGTGKAIALAENGDADVLLVHHRESEEAFIAKGFGVERFDLMYNDFIIVGPSNDPARVMGEASITQAMKSISEMGAKFISRGDDSGTHKKELELWKNAVATLPDSATHDWYIETGRGMGASINVAADMNAYILTDRATWLNFNNKGSLKIVLENDPKLFNYYGIMMVSPDKHAHIKKQAAQKFIDWMLSEDGQSSINQYKIQGQQAFFANAAPQ